MLRRPLLAASVVAAAAAFSLLSLPASAALDVGDKAPPFVTPAAKAGKTFSFSLAESLAQGPVVLYFFPAAFSEGCSLEARQFAEAIEQFTSLGATVVGVSGDDIDTLSKFSVRECNGRFPVASDETKAIMKSFEAAMPTRPDFANRISYVISPAGRIVYTYLSLNPSKHVEKTLGALRDWKKTQN
jgi:thioredoxin-dependent peroxiredoxin